MGGVAGAAFGSKLFSDFRENWCDRTYCTFSVYPSAKATPDTFKPIDTGMALLAAEVLTENVDQAICFDTELMAEQGVATVAEMGSKIASVMSDVTSPYRFYSPMQITMKQFSVHMNMFPRLHFYMPTLNPTRSSDPNEALQQLFTNKSSSLCDSAPDTIGRYMTQVIYLRGPKAILPYSGVNEAIQNILARSSNGKTNYDDEDYDEEDADEDEDEEKKKEQKNMEKKKEKEEKK